MDQKQNQNSNPQLGLLLEGKRAQKRAGNIGAVQFSSILE